MFHLFFILLVACSDALTHGLSHDHWQPFLETAKARGWGGRHTLKVTAAGAGLHLTGALGIGLLTSLFVPPLTRRLGWDVPFGINLGVIIVACLYAWKALADLRRGAHHHGLREDKDHCRAPHVTKVLGGIESPRQEVACGAVLGIRPDLDGVPLFIAASAYGLTRSLPTLLVWGAVSILSLIGMVALGYYHHFTAATEAGLKAFAWWDKHGPVVTAILLAGLGLSGLF